MPYGYFTQHGYMGRVQDHMILFASERDYLDYLESKEVQSFEKENDRKNEVARMR